ncbi:4-hydroxy-tetrahydrodipicolinate reductase [Taibaiella sp. KBW10]|uniref:4-hydroxy-tetrahydrodipicolinate reductase n=1 Tax=Taibaiella sp. KBW10 TaxID=2153357 RepID=UPI000F5A3051|nr:4-hydroxy-tetrahydrodipicolinate reductase [Taibaiella sp. KBW10]RQO29776.1 4-hydroxy-tetrahydrodipicolinate reductase [Taibaiella sp. KBW10]
MKIALVGYGKMGKTIERIAQSRGHEIVLTIGSKNTEDYITENIQKADAVIEFTRPELALNNVSQSLKAGVPVVCGTTGWNESVPQAAALCAEHQTALIQSSNFSIGVNIFFELNKQLAQMMNHQDTYQVGVSETHHTQKLDAPSGTAITIAEQIVQQLERKNKWVKEEAHNDEELAIQAFRVDEVPGIHVVTYHSEIDDIEIKHTAHNRDGFALGAVLAAEFLVGKQGLYTMQDVLFPRK